MTSRLHSLYFRLQPQGATATARAHGLDLSKYDQWFRPSEATGQLDFAIQRASYGYTKDELFDQLVLGTMQVGVRGAYHYLSSGLDWRAQADKFLEYVSGWDFHFYACDFEGAFNTLSTAFAYNAWQWIAYVKGRTGKKVVLYTSPSLYNSYITPSGAAYGKDWNTVDLWTAQWFFIPNPDGTPTMPAGRTGGWRFWQYTNKGNGLTYGLGRPTAGDLDVYNGTLAELRTWLGMGSPPPPGGDQRLRLYEGVERVTGTRFGRRFSLVISDPAKVRYEAAHVLTGDQRDTVSNIAKAKGAQIGWNGGEWDKSASPYYPRDYSVANGNVYVNRKEAVPSLMVLDSGRVVIDHRNTSGVRQAISGLRYLVQNGLIPDYLNGTEPQYTDNRARSIDGLDGRGFHLRLTVEGVYPDLGVTLKEAAQLMVEYGAVLAFDEGGGGDTTEVIGGHLTNIPEDIDPQTGQHVERRIPQFLLLYATTTGGSSMYTGKTNSVAKLWNTVGGGQIGELPAGVTVTGDAPRADGYVYLRTPEAGYTKKIWISNYVESTTPPPPPPPTGTETVIKLTYDSAGTLTGVNVDGLNWVKP